MLKRQLPPLNALRVFEAAARSESFSQAAETLCVTQSAISKQIRLLEQHIDTPLFERHGGTVTLTHEGQDYLKVISEALDIIEAGSEQFYHPEQKETLTVNISPSLSVLWMFARVEDFHKQYPKVLLRIDSADDAIDWSRSQADVAVRCIPQYKKPVHGQLLCQENLRLIAHPELLKGKKLSNINELQIYQRIHLKNRPNLWDQFFGVHDHITANSYCRCEHFHMVVQAVLENLGIGLVPDFLCESLLKEGKLVNPLDIHLPTDYGYYLITPAHRQDKTKVIQFTHWITQAFSRST